MSVKLLKMKLGNVTNFKDGALDMDFFAEKRVYAEEIEESTVTNLFGNTSKLNTIALVGRNATGKTITLNIISDILKVYVDNASLSNTVHIKDYFENTLTIENVLIDNKYLYKIVSHIVKNKQDELVFEKEKLYRKEYSKKTRKKDLLLFTADNLYLEREKILTQASFLKSDDSIFSSILNNEVSNDYMVRDLSKLTNFNLLSFFSEELPLSFIQYLDPSIEEFYMTRSENKSVKEPNFRFCIKFSNYEKLITTDVIGLEDYLSSGTIKGINILFNVLLVLKNGGYLLIDEIEKHLDKSIVINLIDLFMKNTNKRGATLIFATHYSEILDTIERSDSIYVLDKSKTISHNKFSKLAKNKDRIDKKKSDLFLSGELGSSPTYVSYQKLKKDLKSLVSEGAD